MKNTPFYLISAIFLSKGSLVLADNSPVGEISTNGNIYRAGTYPEINWQINHNPLSILEWVFITPDGKIVAKSDLVVRAKILAADVQELTKYWNGFKYVTSARYVPTVAYARANNQSWKVIFQGDHSNVDPTQNVWEYSLRANDEISFASKAVYTSLKWHFTTQNDETVLILKDGQTPPVIATWDTQTTLGSHISAYLDEEGRIDVGPRDIIVAFELTGDPKKGNNGHGNNADGYDSSNPGKKPGIDLSGDFDDENKAVTSGDDVDPVDFQDMVILLTFSAE